MKVLLGKNIKELQQIAAEAGLPRFAGKQLAEWLYKKRAASFDEMTNISKQGRERLSKDYTVGRHAPVAQAVSKDGTVKYLFEVYPTQGGNEKRYIESVFLPEDDRATVCISTQAGCKMGCKFCMTGTLGFHGNLSAADILNQIFEIDRLHGGCLTNIVYMGEGEPMDNIDEVLRSLDIMTSEYGCAWSPKRITVSTVGYLKNIQRYLDSTDCHIALSLHNPFHEERAEIMPIEKAYKAEDVITLLKQYDFTHQRRVSFEYICFGGKNDTKKHADELIKMLSGLECRVNLIRYHNIGGTFPATDEDRMTWLRDYLTTKGITTTIRRSRGEDILAACGMLVNDLEGKNKEK